MDAAELLKRVRRVEITTRKLSDRIFSGEYSSAFKGRGMAFAENREYLPGDEVRTIDWNVTARTGTPHVKVFEEERELTVFLLIDVSGSVQGGTRERTQMDLLTELSAVLAFSATTSLVISRSYSKSMMAPLVTSSLPVLIGTGAAYGCATARASSSGLAVN